MAQSWVNMDSKDTSWATFEKNHQSFPYNIFTNGNMDSIEMA